MLVRDLLKEKKPSISFEVFPPKRDLDIEGIFETIDQLKDLEPDFISVTYGAGGTSKDLTVDIASRVKKEMGIETIAHLTCATSSVEEVNATLDGLDQAGVHNVLALRGDIPPERRGEGNKPFTYASDLISHVKDRGTYSVGGACYPEGHLESSDLEADIRNLKKKADLGLDFLITQLFYDNETLFRFKDRLESHGIQTPLIAGILPVLNKKQIIRIQQLSGCTLPKKFLRILNRYEHDPAALKEAGTAYATEQIIDLLSWGVDGVHIYTMNKAETTRRIVESIGSIRKNLVRTL